MKNDVVVVVAAAAGGVGLVVVVAAVVVVVVQHEDASLTEQLSLALWGWSWFPSFETDLDM